MKKQIKHANSFSSLVSKLIDHGFKMNEIAEKIGIHKPNSTLGDNSVMTKLCNGTLKSFRKKSLADLGTALLEHKDFALVFRGIRIDVSKFDLLFLLYYWSASQKVKIGLLGIVENKIADSKFYYLEKSGQQPYMEKYSLDVISFVHEYSETLDMVLGSKKSSGSTFISAHLGSKELHEIEISFCSYCGAMGTTQKSYAGIGLLQKVTMEDFGKKMEELNENGIPPQIVNVLYNRRFDLNREEVEIFRSSDTLNSTQRDPLKLVHGTWVGYFLRNSIEGPGDSGGIVKVIMDVFESGVASIYFRETDNPNTRDMIVYNGFLKFPVNNSGTITIGEFQNQNNINRLIMHLKPETQRLKGVFTGWRTIDFGYFTSPVYFEKIYPVLKNGESHEGLIDRLIEEYKPARYHKSRTESYSREIAAQLKSIQDKTFDTVETCLLFT